MNKQPETQSVSVEENWKEGFKKLMPCINPQCDNEGTIPNRVSEDEWEPEQCEYCYRERFPIREFIESTLHTHSLATEEVKVDENTSDGYHTFKELYEYRLLYNAALFNEWSKRHLYEVHKSERHNDSELCFGGGWFIVMATLPTGQISNHYENKDWDLFKCRVAERADEWDGHTPQDVAERLRGITLSDSNLE